ncbi:DUF2157 domain-containing protein [Leptospira weilii]|uniref:Membrane protein, PF09925 family n=1 Tax=Leptospira weilii str. 2006001855 TaxID=996804 RepID=M6FK28_9LEPT|nr:DUF2157 domain-containing protein [Leptospira weilii]EMM70479.1 membrane protein, PF09925 family [Leptospira weilii str. 2006001855]MCL8265444.1 DUF2157 domain-containing protein [Leptospira weilii]
MRLEQKLKRWVEAGLIASEQSDAIRNFEATRKTPYLYYSFIILGVIVIGIGVIAILAANWEEIHDFVKLGAGLVTLLLAAGFAFWKRENPNLLTVFIVLNSILILGMIGLVSQVYNLEGKYYEAAKLWCILTFLFLIATDSKTFLHLWSIGFQIYITGWIIEQTEHGGENNWKYYWNTYFYYSAIGFTGIWLAAEKFTLESRRATLFFWAVLFLIVGTFFRGFFQDWTEIYYDPSENLGYFGYRTDFPWLMVGLRLFVLAPFFYLLFYNMEISSNQKKSLSVSLFLLFLLYFPHPFRYVLAESIGSHIWNYFVRLLPSFLFILFWLGIASSFRDHKKIFDLSLAIVGIRFLYFYFDLLGTLTYTGFGLIVSGLLIIGLTIGYLKYKSKVRILLGGEE